MLYEVRSSDLNKRFESFEQAFRYLKNIKSSVNYCLNGSKSEIEIFVMLVNIFMARKNKNDNLLLAAIVLLGQSNSTSDQMNTYLALIRLVDFNDEFVIDNVFEKQEK